MTDTMREMTAEELDELLGRVTTHHESFGLTCLYVGSPPISLIALIDEARRRLKEAQRVHGSPLWASLGLLAEIGVAGCDVDCLAPQEIEAIRAVFVAVAFDRLSDAPLLIHPCDICGWVRCRCTSPEPPR